MLKIGGCLSIEEPEAREWTMMAAINIGALIEYGQPQGVLPRADVLSQLGRNPGAAAAATKAKLARKAHTDEEKWKLIAMSGGRVAIWRLPMPNTPPQMPRNPKNLLSHLRWLGS